MDRKHYLKRHAFYYRWTFITGALGVATLILISFADTAIWKYFIGVAALLLTTAFFSLIASVEKAVAYKIACNYLGITLYQNGAEKFIPWDRISAINFNRGRLAKMLKINSGKFVIHYQDTAQISRLGEFNLDAIFAIQVAAQNKNISWN